MITGVIATMQYYTEPLVAGQVASGQIGGSGQQVEPGYPDGSTLTLPQLVYNLGFQRFDIGAACVIAMVLFVLSMVFAAFLMRAGSGFLAGERLTMTLPDPVVAEPPTTDAAGCLEWVAVHSFAVAARPALRAALRLRRARPR